MADKTLIYVGAEAGHLYRKEAGQTNWEDMVSNGLPPSPEARAIAVHPNDPETVFIGTQRGVYRSRDRGDHWERMDMPEGRIVWSIRFQPGDPGTMYLGTEGSEVYHSDDAGESWREISGNLPSDFGFPIAVHPAEPETIYVVPIKSDSEHYPPEGRLRVYRSRTGGDEWEALTNGLPQEHCYVNVLRDAMAVDTLDSCGIYFGTTAGQIYVSADAGDTWAAVVRDLPPVLSVEVQTLP